jgi:predicted permease
MRLYKILLYLYPASFRSEYAAEIAHVFAERRRMASNRIAVILLWIESFFEILFNAAHVHWDILRQDLHYTGRGFIKAPGFALTAVIVTALGIGTSTAVFSITDHVLIRPLPFTDSDRIVKLWESLPGVPYRETSPPNYRDWKRLSTSFESMGAYASGLGNVIGPRDPQKLEIAAVTTEAFATLGVQPILGRSFTSDDDRGDTTPIVTLSYGLWQSEFGADPGVVGKTLRIDDTTCTIIGVMPPAFHFPNRTAQLWRHLSERHPLLNDRNRNNKFLYVLARLKPTVSLEQARAEAAVVSAQLEREHPKENEKTASAVIPLRDEVTGQSRLLLGALFGASLCVLLIACTNLASLMLARGIARQRELTVRSAIGAGRERLIRQLLTESLLLAAFGGVAGIVVTVSGLPLLQTLVPANVPVGDATAIDFRVLVFAALLTFVTGLAFGVVPALQSCSATHLGALRSKSGIGVRRERLRSVLVVAQVMASIVLLITSGLLIRALWRVQAIDPGFRTENVLTMSTPLPGETYETLAQRVAFYTRVLSEVRTLPGVTDAAYISFLPMVMRGGVLPVNAVQGTADNKASLRFVTPGLFRALGIPFRQGRDASEMDTLETPFVAVVSESFAARHFPGLDPIGQQFEFAGSRRRVVGVVGDIHVRGLETTSEPQVYLPYKQMAGFGFYSPKELIIRSSTNPIALVPAIRRIVQTIDPELPLDVRTLRSIVEGETGARAAQVRILGAFTTLSLFLAGLGLYGLLSFTVSQRIPEIGVRLALGAQRIDILRMIFGNGLLLAGTGCVLGLAAGYASGRWLEALLAGVKPSDWQTFLAAVALASFMTIAGSLLPALRATRVDPTTVIRMD